MLNPTIRLLMKNRNDTPATQYFLCDFSITRNIKTAATGIAKSESATNKRPPGKATPSLPRRRATGTSWGDGGGHIGGAVAPFIVVAALSLFGARGDFELLAIIVLISGFIVLLGPKTTGLALTISSKISRGNLISPHTEEEGKKEGGE